LKPSRISCGANSFGEQGTESNETRKPHPDASYLGNPGNHRLLLACPRLHMRRWERRVGVGVPELRRSLPHALWPEPARRRHLSVLYGLSLLSRQGCRKPMVTAEGQGAGLLPDRRF